MPTSFEQMDLLRQAEKIAANASSKMKEKNKNAFSRYPILFMLLIVFGIVAIDEGMKEILVYSGLSDKPFILVLIGLIILILTGTLFKKLDDFRAEE